MAVTPTVAQGAPGIPARWTSSAKSGVGTGLSANSPLWFTISHGILNEVYYPRLDSACTRDLGLIITGPDGYFSEEKRDAAHLVEPFEAGVPGYRLVNTAVNGSYRIEKRIVTDSKRPVLLQEITFAALKGSASDYQVYALLAPHLVNRGMGNTAWVGEHKGQRVLFASGRGVAGPMSPAPNSAPGRASTATMSASHRPTVLAPLRRRTVSCRSRTGRPAIAIGRPRPS